jgi:hypothetical protein
MPYHVRIVRRSSRGNSALDVVSVNLSAAVLRERVLSPYRADVSLFLAGTKVLLDDIESIRITYTAETAEELRPRAERLRSEIRAAFPLLSVNWFIAELGKDVTDDLIKGPPGTGQIPEVPEELPTAKAGAQAVVDLLPAISTYKSPPLTEEKAEALTSNIIQHYVTGRISYEEYSKSVSRLDSTDRVGSLAGSQSEQIKFLEAALSSMYAWSNMDSRFLKALALYVRSDRRERKDQLRAILVLLLRDAFQVFNEDFMRATVLVPDPTREYLQPLASINAPEPSLASTRFYIGSGSNRPRGVVGQVFLRQATQIVHLVKVRGTWKADNPNFVHYSRNHEPSFRSVAAVPILGPKIESLGVLSFDSLNPSAFDSDVVRQLLQALSDRVAVLLVSGEE